MYCSHFDSTENLLLKSTEDISNLQCTKSILIHFFHRNVSFYLVSVAEQEKHCYIWDSIPETVHYNLSLDKVPPPTYKVVTLSYFSSWLVTRQLNYLLYLSIST